MKRESKATINKKKRRSMIKKAYAWFHENIVATIVIFVALTCVISFAIISTTDFSQKLSFGNNDEKKYETMINQRFPISTIRTLNPIVSQDKDTYYISKLLYNGLFSYDSNMSLAKDLVNDYTVNSSNGIVKISLKPNVSFHNGEGLSAADVQFTIKSIQKDGEKGPYYSIGKKIKNVEANGRELTIEFNKPSDAALNNLIFPILCETDYSTGSDYKPVGTGQYRIYSMDLSKRIVLEPNDSYDGTIAKNDLYFNVFPSSTDLTSLISSYDITSLLYTGFNGKSISEDKKIEFKPIVSNNLEYMGFSFKNELLKQKKLRQAIACAVDMPKLVESAYPNMATCVDSMYLPNYLGVENKGDPYPYDYNKAVSLLNELQLADKNEDGYLEDINGDDIVLKILVNENAPNRCMAAEKIKNSLDQIKIKAEINKLSWDDYIKSIQKRDFDILLGGYTIDKNDNLSFLFDKDNYMSYENKEISEDVARLNTAQDIDDVKALYEQIKNEINDELPYYPICYKNYSLLGVKNSNFETLPTFDNIYGGVSTWSYEQEEIAK